ncbi:MAG: S-methyl-5'-thioadenosine phosphorylase [bacterium]|nr:S-methyl-5'-thioadenosine phosphorylase [bacterium]
MEKVDIGIIGGSGFYQMEGIDDTRQIEIDTPFGKPSEKILLGKIHGKNIAFLSRHGIGHRINPSEINYRANLYALKSLGVSKLFSVSAVGSLKAELKPMDLVIWDQFFDNTFKRKKTYFEDGMVSHVSMAHPTCHCFSKYAFQEAKKVEGLDVHIGGALYNMEGPQFSTKAESNIYRQLGLSIIGMTQAIESKLARELEICFTPLSFVTDYDCWHEEHDAVTVDMVGQYMTKNAENAAKLIRGIVAGIDDVKIDCGCNESLKGSLITNLDLVPDATYEKLKLIIEKYLPGKK